MNILLLRGFNNYFNRIVKKHTTIANYKSNSQSYIEYSNVNFNSNDGVTTELILGSTAQKESGSPLAWENNGTPDYLVCHEVVSGTTVIRSRWFVLESERTRDGQYRLALRRDVLAEYLTNIKSAPCYVEKGIVNNATNPLIVNPEGISVNQIKQSETPLVDNTKSAWLVGYIKKNYSGRKTSGVMPEDANASNTVYDYNSLPIKDFIDFVDGSQSATKKVVWINNSDCLNIFYTIRASVSPVDHYYDYRGALVWGNWFDIEYQGSQGNPGYGDLTNNLIHASNNNGGPTTNWADYMEQATGSSGVIPTATVSAFINFLKSNAKTTNNLYEANEIVSGATYSSLKSTYNNAIIEKNGRYYKLSFSDNNSNASWSESTVNASASAIIGNYMSYVVSKLNTNVSGTTFTFNGTTAGNSLQISLQNYQQTITATEINNVSNAITITIPSYTDRFTCKDAQYDIFAIPFIPSQYRSRYTGPFIATTGSYAVNSNASLFIAQKLMTDLGISMPSTQDGSWAYDLQLLPYCPMSLPITDNKVDLTQLNEKSFKLITRHVVAPGGAELEIPESYVIFPKTANFTVDIACSKSITPGTNSTALATKLSNECDFLRLTAPNFNSSYEFKLSKMSNRSISTINVDCTYKPINPYIKLNPNFSWLYGQDFNDSTGLIFNGDFSLATLSDAWINYEHNNKNYQTMFNRQIQSMDVNQQLAREQMAFQNMVGAITGPVAGGVSGAMAGAKYGGGYGAAAGAAVGIVGGTALSVMGGLKNNEWLAKQQGEAKNYAIDMYNYQLGNIKALPQSLTKADPLTYNNKVWPILEEFSCTSTEKDMVKNKIKYNGMTIMAVGTINDYSTSTDFSEVFVKGQLIRLTGVNDDFHVIDAIYEEVNKGFYLPQ